MSQAGNPPGQGNRPGHAGQPVQGAQPVPPAQPAAGYGQPATGTAGPYGVHPGYGQPAPGAPSNYGVQPMPGAGPNYGVQPGYGARPSPPAAPAYGQAQARNPMVKKASPWRWLAFGCATVLLLAVVVTGATAYRYYEQATRIEGQLAAAVAAKANRVPEGDCRKAYDCCVRITVQANDQSLLSQCEAFKAAGRPPTECTSALTGYRRVAATRSLSCD